MLGGRAGAATVEWTEKMNRLQNCRPDDGDSTGAAGVKKQITLAQQRVAWMMADAAANCSSAHQSAWQAHTGDAGNRHSTRILHSQLLPPRHHVRWISLEPSSIPQPCVIGLVRCLAAAATAGFDGWPGRSALCLTGCRGRHSPSQPESHAILAERYAVQSCRHTRT